MQNLISRRQSNAERSGLNRRFFLKAGLATTGGLFVTIALPGIGNTANDSEQALTAWVRIGPDNSITIAIPSAEMGQGVTTSLAMLVAEELEADWANVRPELAQTDKVFANPKIGMQATFGSNSIRGFFDPLRKAGATAREMLRQAAANEWNVPIDECVAKSSRITHISGKSLGYGKLAGKAADLPMPEAPTLKPKSAWNIIGKPTPRLDTPQKVNGTAGFGIDVTLPDLLIATIAISPRFGGKLASVDEAPAMAVSGVKSVVKLQDAVAVVAEGYWQARKGLLALDLKWDNAEASSADATSIAKALEGGFSEEGAVAENEGDVIAAIAGAKTHISATYNLPFLAHTTMEPMNATAMAGDDACEIWAPTQAPQLQAQVIGQIFGYKDGKVKVNSTFLGGGFGRKSELDFIIQAVAISKSVGGKPVKLIWSREEDVQHDFYRGAAMANMSAGIDAQGNVTGWDVKLVAPSILARAYPPGIKDGLDPLSVEGLVAAPYSFGARKVSYVMKDLGVPVGFWRSIGNSVTGFLAESFVDEMADAIGKDPVEFRLGLLGDKPRHRAVLEKAAKMANWGNAPASGRFRGVAMHESMGSIVAEIVEISLINKSLRVHQVDCVIDCGVAVNPSTIIAQMEGGIVYGLSAALNGEVTLQNGQVEQSNFDTKTPLKMAQMPKINVAIIDSEEAPGGAGEPSTPPIGPALVNAIYQSTGQRLRSLPISAHGYAADG